MIHYINDNFNEFRDDYFKKENRVGYMCHKKVEQTYITNLL